MLKWLKSHSKAIGSAVVAAASTYTTVQDGGVTGNEFLAIVIATAAAAGLTWALPFGTGPGSVNGLPPAQQ